MAEVCGQVCWLWVGRVAGWFGLRVGLLGRVAVWVQRLHGVGRHSRMRLAASQMGPCDRSFVIEAVLRGEIPISGSRLKLGWPLALCCAGGG